MYIKQLIMELKEENDGNKITVGDFNTHPTYIPLSSLQHYLQ